MKLAQVLTFSVFSILVMVICLLAFSFILLNDIEYYNFKNYVVQPTIFISVIYGFMLVPLTWFIKSKTGLIVTILLAFTAIYLFMTFQIAFEARGEFGATWLPSEVFWELSVQKGKALYIWITGSILSTKSATIFLRKAIPEKNYKNP